MTFYDFLRRGRSSGGIYERLPADWQNPTNSTGGVHSKFYTLKRVLLAAAFSCLVTTITLVMHYSRKPFNHIDNFQPLNQPQLVSKTFTFLDTYEPPSIRNRAVVSTLYSDSYALAVAVLGYSIRNANVSASHLLIPYLPHKVSSQGLCIAKAVGWTPMPVPYIPPPKNGRGIVSHFMDQYTKLNIWNITHSPSTGDKIKKLVYLDADTLVLRRFDELFDLPFPFAAVPDVYGPSDPRGFTISFNAGVLVIEPSQETLEVMRDALPVADYPPQDAEQSFLNTFYGPNTLRLPYAYNGNLAIKTRSEKLWHELSGGGNGTGEMRIVHYTINKPFLERDAGAIPPLENVMKIVRKAAERDSGLFKNEVGWWGKAFKDMIEKYGSELQDCYKHRES